MTIPRYVSQLPGSCDSLQQIKMRNRRFQQSCAMETGHAVPQRPQLQPQMVMEDVMAMSSLAYSDLQRQVQLLQTLPSAPIPAPRYTVNTSAKEHACYQFNFISKSKQDCVAAAGFMLQSLITSDYE